MLSNNVKSGSPWTCFSC